LKPPAHEDEHEDEHEHEHEHDPESSATAPTPRRSACWRHAMAGGGELVISVTDGGRGGVELEVADSGRGVGAAAARADGPLSPSHKPGRGGTGLGLGIVRAVADRHRARIGFAARPDGGTAVTVTFPAQPAR
jgi:signal transduction histidine kinase